MKEREASLHDISKSAAPLVSLFSYKNIFNENLCFSFQNFLKVNKSKIERFY